MPIATVNPANGERERTFDELGTEGIERCIARAADSFRSYRSTGFAERAGWMRATADILESDVEAIASLIVTEMGKPIGAARAEVLKCAAACRFYAEHSEAFLADEQADAAAVGASAARAVYQPLGVVLAVMPWNFPLWQAMRFAAPALMAGNVGLLKHASNVPQTALCMEELFRRGGFPEGVFQTLLIGSGAVEAVVRDVRVAAATLTGSESAGRAVARIAGEALKPTVLELGGSDPFIVLPSADVEAAADIAVKARCQNNGQSCIAAKRFIIHDAIADRFIERFVDGMHSLTVGDPMDLGTDIGPLATEQGRAEVEAQVADAVTRGARILCGGERLSGPGWYYPPTVVVDVEPNMRVFAEEVFGPVAAIFRVDGLDSAIELANATSFGLGSNAWTTEPAERDRLIRDLDAGAVFINGMTTSYPELPFGGVKASGYGRELSAHGIRAFCNLKTVWER